MSVIVKGMEMPNIPAFREKDNKVASFMRGLSDETPQLRIEEKRR